MSTDYDAIRAENIARYGWDTAVLELLGQLYSDRTHFIFELVQNAEDACATELEFELLADRLIVRHDGRPFTTADVRGVCGVSQGTKAADLTQIGKFGIGFKSVYAYTNSPSVESGDERFTIRKYVQPYAANPPAGPAGERTTFTFPFDRAEVPAQVACAEISSALGDLGSDILLFLRHIERIRVELPLLPKRLLLERTSRSGPRTASRRAVVLLTERDERSSGAEWLAWSRALGELGEPELRVEVAFPVRAQADARYLTRLESSPLVVYFPTEKETYLGFRVQGPFRTTPARDNVPEHDEWNQALAGQVADLVRDVLAELRDESLLTADVLSALPLDPARFPAGGLFRPIFDEVRRAVLEDRLIPDDAGGYLGPAQILLPDGAGLRELLGRQQLGQLREPSREGDQVAFADQAISREGTPRLWHYLREVAGVSELTPRSLIEMLTGGFLAMQPDEWISRFYRFLYGYPALWELAGERPVIRVGDGSQILPFTGGGRPAAYLPGPFATAYPTVSEVIAGDEGARQFLTALGFAEADAASEVIDHVLPRYAGRDADVGTLDLAAHEADLELVARALAETAPAEHGELLGRLTETSFLIGENAAKGERRLMRPVELYQRTPGLELYFSGNPGAWFAADLYGPWRAQLRGMGVREEVRLDVRPADELGYVMIADEFARHERGLAGFDPAASLDGLEFALNHPGADKAEFIWNSLLLPNRHLLTGTTEQSPRLGFADARREKTKSLIGKLATGSAWLPGPDGSFLRPAEIDLSELPGTFARDDGLAQALGMTLAVVDEANRELGFPPEFLRRLAAQPDLVEMVERELVRRERGGGPAGPPLSLL